MAMKVSLMQKEMQLRTLDCSRMTQVLDGRANLFIGWPKVSPNVHGIMKIDACERDLYQKFQTRLAKFIKAMSFIQAAILQIMVV